MPRLLSIAFVLLPLGCRDAEVPIQPDAVDDPMSPCGEPPAEGFGLVRTEAGVVSGVASAEGIAFKGIPYAEPPVGEGRWRPPRPATCWSGVRAATGFGYVCMQPAISEEPGSTPVGSEDCLTVNVWTPEARRGADLPVLVFVHGGYFTWGSASHRIEGVEVYDGAELAARGRVVVVTLNYRLGALGFIGHPGLSAESPQGASGNYGLLDQLAALGWVQRNIAGFGGDPQRVVLFGQSAGAISTSALYASPLARGLFAGAILHSGAAGRGHPREESEGAGALLAAQLGCEGAPDEVACLRAHSAAEIVAGLPESFDGGYTFGPTVDGWVLPDRPLELIGEGRGNAVPLIVGVTADEFTRMIRAYLTEPIDSAEAYAAFLRRRFGQVLGDRLLAHYPASVYPTPLAAAVAVMGDVAFVCPSRRLARAAAAHAPTRRFVYAHVASAGPAAVFRAAHGFDLPYVFRHFVLSTPTEDELALSDLVIAAWSRFAADGDPSGEGLVWPAYDPAVDPYLVLDTPIATGAGFHAEDCDFLDRL